MPRRLATRRFWVRNRGVVGYLILVVATGIALHVGLAAAKRGDEAHAALCANRADLRRRVDQNLAYLRMPVSERIRRYGVEFAHVPKSTVLVQITNYERTIRSYDALRC